MSKNSIIIEMDGDAWCAHRDNFVNLQVSSYGFGSNPNSALIELLKEEIALPLRKALQDACSSLEIASNILDDAGCPDNTNRAREAMELAIKSARATP